MSHPLRHLNPHNQLGNSADFSQYDIVNDSDFAQDKYEMGDFSNYGEEIDDELMSGFGSGIDAIYGLMRLTLTLISFLSSFILMFPFSLTFVMRNGPDHFAANFLFLLRKFLSSNQIF
jgi:hypothetical protein